jgi:CRISPR-associated protein Cas2
MDMLLAYDVATYTPEGKRRLRRVAKLCESYGVRVQNSVFDLIINPHELETLLARINDIVEPSTDGVRIYRLYGREPVAVIGRQRPVATTRGPLVF